MKKFRVYDLDNKKMSDVFDITQNPKYWIDKIVDGDIMQFTGLIDSEGKEIYEKDFVLVINYGRNNRSYSWLGVVKRINNYFVIESETKERILYQVADNQRIRVIGNVYENEK